MALSKYLKTFFDEKQLPSASWELRSSTGVVHWIDSEVVIEAIGKASTEEQTAIAAMIRKIDFVNGDVSDYLKHLAGALVAAY